MMLLMQYVRTQIYLESAQHRLLKEEAHRLGVSLTELVRQLVAHALGDPRAGGDLTGLIGIETSAGGDISRDKDAWLAEAAEGRLKSL